MKVLIVVAAACFVSCVSAGHLGGGYGASSLGAPLGGGYGALSLGAPLGAAPLASGGQSTGSSSQFREEDSFGNYKFGYDESHASGRSGRREERNGGVVHGSYSLADADGRDRTVHYVADASGFRATIHTNEPGVDASREPAAVLINKEGFAAAPAPEQQVIFSAAPAPHRPAGPVAYGPAAPLPAASAAFATKGYAAAPAPVFASAPSYGPAPAASFENNQRQAFSYSFGTTHPSLARAPIFASAPAPAFAPAPAYAPAPAPAFAPAPLAAPAPIFQQSIKY